ncbi:TBP-associated factor 3 [Cotesia typhae]|uniref:TBP-associated factor 3 n=1 Tax=Cotesia typhae TaxID=2053667 RepID=UPI003D6960B6
MAEYSRGVLQVIVAQICQSIGWRSIHSTPLEFMVDLLHEYLWQLAHISHEYAGVLGRTEVNLDDVGLAFQHMNIDLSQLAEYVENVGSIPCAIQVPKYPVAREDHLNFMKPGSREVLKRPMHIPEYLPPMYPKLEELEPVKKEVIFENDENVNTNQTTPSVGPAVENQMSSVINNPVSDVMKRPGDPLLDSFAPDKRIKLSDETKTLREIQSVMMTTSGFLSPAREGKLPESRTPAQIRSDSPPAVSYPMNPCELPVDKPKEKEKEPEKVKEKEKEKKVVKKKLEYQKADKESKKKIREQELFKADKMVTVKPKKAEGKNATPKPPKGPVGRPRKFPLKVPVDKPAVSFSDNIKKLPVEPDKQKLTIFKKISKAQEHNKVPDVPESKAKELVSRESSPEIIVDEIDDEPVAVKIDHAEKDKVKSGGNIDVDFVDIRSPDTFISDMSPPRTPTVPKTPEIKVPEIISDQEIVRKMDRPKTPEFKPPDSLLPKDTMIPPGIPFPIFPPFPPGPGLIPYPINHPLIPRMPLPQPQPRLLPEQIKVEREREVEIIEDVKPPQVDFILRGIGKVPESVPVLPGVKIEKPDKKKKHKVDKKDKVKKKKEKKEKHREKTDKEKKEKRKEKKEKEKEEKEKEKEKKEEKEKEKERDKDKEEVIPKLTLKVDSIAVRPPTPENPIKKITFKPLPKKLEESKATSSLAVSSLVKEKPLKEKVKKVKSPSDAKKALKAEKAAEKHKDPVPVIAATIVGPDGQQIWICPTCGKQDDGTPMIGCDECDAWYHWICIGMHVPPASNENWYCSFCIAKKNEAIPDKKKQKKKVKINV